MTTQTKTLQHTNRIVRATPVFYGWVILFVAAIGLMATSPGQSFSVSLFIDHYIVDFGLDRTSVSGLFGLGTFIASLSLTWVGKRIDTLGNRRMAIIITALFGVALLACALISSPIMLLISFIAIRGLGQGSLGLVSSTAVAQWFRQRRGMVMGLALVAFAVFQRFYLPALQGFMDQNGWRASWLLLGAVILLVVLPLMVFLLQHRPEDFGMVPDGVTPSEDTVLADMLEENWSLGEAMHTVVFWVFAMARMLAGAWGTALIFHQVSIFAQLGYGPEVAAATYGQAALMTAGFTFVAGWLVDRLKPGMLIAIQMSALMAATALPLLQMDSLLILFYTVAIGVMMGVGSVFDGTVWVNLFGRQNQGAIRGFVATAGVMGTAAGPIIFGLAFDNTGQYHVAQWIGIGLALLILTSALLVRLPRARQPEASPAA